MKGLRARHRDRLLELDEVERRLKPFGRRYLGVRAIPLDALVGTDSRADSFTRDFRPLHAFSRDRLRSLEAAFPDGGFPPIVTVKLGEAYFVIDGHHRAALARRGGAEMIDADVTELIARVPLPAGADMLEVVLRELERIFLEDSGLAEARSGVRVSVSRPAHYLELLENVQVHGYHLMRGRGRVLEDAVIAANWYDAIYTPTLAVIERLRLGSALPRRPGRRSVPRSPPAPAGCVPLDRLRAPRADRRLGDRRRRAAPAAADAGPREPVAGLDHRSVQ